MDRRTFIRRSLLGGVAVGLGSANVMLFYARNKRREPPIPDSHSPNPSAIASPRVRDEDTCSIAFSLRGSRLASASANDILSVWDSKTDRCLSTCPARHGAPVTSIGFCSDDRWLATISKGRSAKFWTPGADRETGFNLFSSDPLCVCFSPALKAGMTPPPSVAAIGFVDSCIRVVEYNELSQIMLAETLSQGRKNPHATQPVSLFGDVAVLKGHTEKVNAVSFSEDGALLASASDDQTIRIWDTSTWKEIAALRSHTGHVNSISFSKDGSRLASASDDRTIIIWDHRTMTRLGVMHGHDDAVLKAVFCHQDSNWLASVSSNKTTILWSLHDGFREGIRLPVNPGRYPAIDFSADGQYFASAWGRGVRFWKTSVLQDEAKRKLGVA